MVAEGEAFNPHDLTLFYHVAVLAWTQFSSTENVSFSIGPLGIWASKLEMFWGPETVASAQKGTTPWTVKSWVNSNYDHKFVVEDLMECE